MSFGQYRDLTVCTILCYYLAHKNPNSPGGENNMIEVKKRKNESFESLMRRFRKQVQQSGVVLQAKKVQYRKSHKSKNTVRASTLIRLKRKDTLAYLEKIGKTPTDK